MHVQWFSPLQPIWTRVSPRPSYLEFTGDHSFAATWVLLDNLDLPGARLGQYLSVEFGKAWRLCLCMQVPKDGDWPLVKVSSTHLNRQGRNGCRPLKPRGDSTFLTR